MILGNEIIRIQRPTARHLIFKIPDIKRKYIQLLEGFVLENNLPQMLRAIHNKIVHIPAPHI